MVAAKKTPDEPDNFLTEAEGWEILDTQARKALGMSAAEFVRAWAAGEIEDPDRPEVMDGHAAAACAVSPQARLSARTFRECASRCRASHSPTSAQPATRCPLTRASCS